ncbi:MAG: histidine kinase N-terminal 7TM domain-containing protein [Chloroflexota bacterium]
MPASYQLNAYNLPLFAAAAVSLGIAIYAWSQRRAHSAVTLGLLALTIAAWCLGYALEIGARDFAAKVLWGKLQYIGITTVPLAWLIFAMRHTLRGKRPPGWMMFAISLPPLATTLLAFTTEMHGWLWQEIGLYEGPGFSALETRYGFWFWIHVGYSYLMLLGGTGLILRMLAKREGMYRSQAATLLIATLAPWAGNALYIFRISPIPYLDLTPFAFTVTIVGLTWAIFGYKLVNLSPLARDLLVDSMADGMLVVDGRARVVDMNPAAGRMLGVAVSDAIGKPVVDTFAPWPGLLEHIQNQTDTNAQIAVGAGAARRTYELRISPLRDRQGRWLGHTIMLREVGGAGVPAPRYGPHDGEKPAPTRDANEPRPESANAFVGRLLDFLRIPIKTDLPMPPHVNPKWYQARERSFTLILRVAALFSTLAFLVGISFSNFQISKPYPLIILILWFLGLVRHVNFNYRALTFLVLLYAVALVETYSFGYSVESILFFLALNVVAVLMLGRNGSLAAFAASIVTLGFLGIQIGRGAFVPPLAAEGAIVPATLPQAIAILLRFWLVATALIVSTLVLMESLNRAWRLETQAVNLLQQERDLLEMRVQERTRDLAEARDEAVRNRDEMRKYFLAIEQSGNTIVITDPSGKIEYANPHFTTLTGYRLEEAIGQNPRILQSGEHDRAFYQELWETIRGGLIWHGEFYNRRKDGSLFWESATIAPVLNHLGEITHYIAIKEDITAQKELQERLRVQNEQMAAEIAERIVAETRLQESEARFRQIVENASDIIYRTDKEGYFTYVNPPGLRVTGFEEKELVGQRFLRVIHPDARHRVQRFYTRQVVSKTLNTYLEFPLIGADGGEIWLGQNVQIILKDGEVIGLQALARDITERKRFEDALAVARDQALEASQVKSQLLSKVNHELRTPLGGILGYAELLRTGTFGPLAPEQDQAVAEIMDSVNYLTGIVNELLDAAQIEARKLTLKMEPCNPRTILKQVEGQLSVLAAKKGLELIAEASPDLPEAILGDESRLKQVVINLVGNAIKFTQAGEIHVKMFLPDANHWIIQVRDTGIGIPAEAHGHIFEPFRQVQTSSTRDHRGTGLGLSITHQLVELMGGEITLESELGRGSLFSVKLPVRTFSELGTRPLTQRKEATS